MKRLFIASTGQNVGKTTVSLGLFAGLQKRFPSLGFIKPVGQQWVEAKTGLRVDKDVLLFRNHFGLETPYEEMSPVLFPSGFTRDFLDGKIDVEALKGNIDRAMEKLAASFPMTLIEGTGHMGVGSIIDLNNAHVASRMKAPMVMVAPGGIGSAFDQIALNKVLADSAGVNLVGVILNKVRPDKLEMVEGYMKKALKRWDVPLLGTIPFDPFLSIWTMHDFEQLFKTKLISGESMRFSHFEKVRMVATSAVGFEKSIGSNQLIITHGAREDIVLALLGRYFAKKQAGELLSVGLILTGHPPRPPIIEQIKKADLPCLFSSVDSFTTMQKITAHIAKIALEDVEKIEEAIQVVERAVDFEMLVQKL